MTTERAGRGSDIWEQLTAPGGRAPGQEWLFTVIQHADHIDSLPRQCPIAGSRWVRGASREDHRWSGSGSGGWCQSGRPVFSLDVPPAAVDCSLGPRLESVRVARTFTRTMLTSWDLVRLVDDMVLVVSELVTNALRHVVLPGVRSGTPEQLILLSLLRRGPHVICAVTDSGDHIPRRRTSDLITEDGRGLQLVESFSRAWGWEPLQHARGKIVWALFTSAD